MAGDAAGAGKVRDALLGGTAKSFVLENHGKRVLDGTLAVEHLTGSARPAEPGLRSASSLLAVVIRPISVPPKPGKMPSLTSGRPMRPAVEITR